MDNKGFNDSSSGERIGFGVDCCVDCGGSLLGNGFTMPIHCENIESPDCACPDEGPFYCGNNERKAALDRAFSHYGTMCDNNGRVMTDEFCNIQKIIGANNTESGRWRTDRVEHMCRLLCNGEDLFYPRDIKSIRGGFSVFMVGPLLKLKPFEYYYQTKFGAFSRNKHPRGNKFQRAVWSVKVANVWGNN